MNAGENLFASPLLIAPKRRDEMVIARQIIIEDVLLFRGIMAS
jgi:hypothetical protein